MDFSTVTTHDAIVIGLNDIAEFNTNANFEFTTRYYSNSSSIASKTPDSDTSINIITGLNSLNLRYMKISRSLTNLITIAYSFDGVNYTTHKTYQETSRNLFVSIYFNAASTINEHLEVYYGSN